MVRWAAPSRGGFASLVRLLNDFDWEPWTAAVEIGNEMGCRQILRGYLHREIQRSIASSARAARESAGNRFATGRSGRSKYGRAATEIRRSLASHLHLLSSLSLKLQVPSASESGLTTEEIAHAFLTSKATTAQRIVRGKARIRDAQIPLVIPSPTDLPGHADAVLAAIYLVFNEGYAASQGPSLIRVDLTAEAIRLGRLLLDLLADPEVKGLLSLMLLHESRRKSRVAEDGEIILLEDQDRSRWDHSFRRHGVVEQALRSRLWCTPSGCDFSHPCRSRHSRAGGWNQIVVLLRPAESIDRRSSAPVGGRVAMRDVQAGWVIDLILSQGASPI